MKLPMKKLTVFSAAGAAAVPASAAINYTDLGAGVLANSSDTTFF
jgi:hypothetical protein